MCAWITLRRHLIIVPVCMFTSYRGCTLHFFPNVFTIEINLLSFRYKYLNDTYTKNSPTKPTIQPTEKETHKNLVICI